MSILLLGPHSELLRGLFPSERLLRRDDPLQLHELHGEDLRLILSFGYRHLISSDLLNVVEHRAYNLHTSVLPWNRGASPNFFSWLNHTPKGVSLHQMSTRIDEGPLVGQVSLEMSPGNTLSESYAQLLDAGIQLVTAHRSALLANPDLQVQVGVGSSHRMKELEEFREALPRGWNTTGGEVEAFGKSRGLWLN